MSIAYFLDKNTFEIKDVVQLQDFQINLDEETNAKTSMTVLKKTNAKDKDFVFIKEKDKMIYQGIIEAPTNKNGEILYSINAKDITNLFDRKIILSNETLISTTGIEDFISYTIQNEFTNSSDTLLNMNFIDIEVLTHTPKNFTVSTDNGIYNFHTFITNCTQKYNIVYSFEIINKRLKITIQNIENNTVQLIDTNTTDILNYNETFKTNIIAKVTVVCPENNFNYYLLNDRTISTDINAENRAVGDIDVIREENAENAYQSALNRFKSNSYSHLIEFEINKDSKLYDVQNWQIGSRVKIKNKTGDVIDTYISAITIKKDNPIYTFKTGNIRINFLDKLKQKEEK